MLPGALGPAQVGHSLGHCVAGVGGAGFAGHRSGAEVVHRLPARVAAYGTVVGLQLVDFEPRPNLPRLLRLVLQVASVSRPRRLPKVRVGRCIR